MKRASVLRNEALQLVWSHIMDFENEANPFEDRRIRIAQWKKLSSEDISPSDEVVKRAQRIKHLGFRPKDELRLSCAIEAGCLLFLTTDLGILRKAALIPELAIINPVDYDFDQP